ncbi:choloylglycine hydrolase [Compostibacillus humi]|uniref:Choloylglycine hydrolase n=1 Tax=Compostibacillus humi TaxID=1245525 RepID=A0A8J3EIL3_9BACI|nr:C45 family peptidase [Compostibacillus humi]GGH71849.1 choloylglycine hydrolase [Compostibacillus humi]
MKQIYSDIIQFRGNHYDFGYEQGLRLKDSLTIENRNKQWKWKRPRFEIDVKEAKVQFKKYAPSIWEELNGLMDALKQPMETILRDYGGYRVEPVKSGCSIFAGEGYFIRNYDFHPKTYDGRYTFFQPKDKGYAIIGPSSRIVGRMDGMNEKGLVMGYNFVHRKNLGDGFVCHMIGRIILETCATVDEAVHLLQEIPHRQAFSYIVMDISGKTCVIEASPRDVTVRKAAVCTNHFEIMTHENRHYLQDSMERFTAIQQYSGSKPDALEAFRFFNDTDKGIFAKQYKSWAGTIHTSGYLPKEGKAWFALGGDQEPYEFHFRRWLRGEDITQEKLYGEVDTNLGFAHMDKNTR